MGGWADDQDANVTLQLAKDAVTSLQLEVDMEEAFVQGVRRGYLVVPCGPRNNESEGNMHVRLTAAIQKVRQARKATGAMNPDGQPKYLWLAYSQTPERRNRARYAGKVKRLLQYLNKVRRRTTCRSSLPQGHSGTRGGASPVPQPRRRRGRQQQSPHLAGWTRKRWEVTRTRAKRPSWQPGMSC